MGSQAQSKAPAPPAVNPLGPPPEVLSTDRPLGVFANDPYFEEIVHEEIVQRLRAERELDTDNPACT